MTSWKLYICNRILHYFIISIIIFNFLIKTRVPLWVRASDPGLPFSLNDFLFNLQQIKFCSRGIGWICACPVFSTECCLLVCFSDFFSDWCCFLVVHAAAIILVIVLWFFGWFSLYLWVLLLVPAVCLWVLISLFWLVPDVSLVFMGGAMWSLFFLVLVGSL